MLIDKDSLLHRYQQILVCFFIMEIYNIFITGCSATKWMDQGTTIIAILFSSAMDMFSIQQIPSACVGLFPFKHQEKECTNEYPNCNYQFYNMTLRYRVGGKHTSMKRNMVHRLLYPCFHCIARFSVRFWNATSMLCQELFSNHFQTWHLISFSSLSHCSGRVWSCVCSLALCFSWGQIERSLERLHNCSQCIYVAAHFFK